MFCADAGISWCRNVDALILSRPLNTNSTYCVLTTGIHHSVREYKERLDYIFRYKNSLHLGTQRYELAKGCWVASSYVRRRVQRYMVSVKLFALLLPPPPRHGAYMRRRMGSGWDLCKVLIRRCVRVSLFLYRLALLGQAAGFCDSGGVYHSSWRLCLFVFFLLCS